MSTNRLKSSPLPMLTLAEALQRVLSAVRVLPAVEIETLSTFDALGRVLATNVVAAVDVPPADNTAMDGYALRCADVPRAGSVLPISQRVQAGMAPGELELGTAARVFTGAHIPAQADAVVMQELCEATDGAVRVNAVPILGQWIRQRGEDVRQGSVVLPRGTRLTPQALGLAASVGAATLNVMRRPRVALFSTGDELVMPGEALKPGTIYNSNRFTLRALIQSLGCECTDLGIITDNLALTQEALRLAAEGHDFIVTSGGVSVGDEDHLRAAVLAQGELDLWQIAIKPGKPFAFGSIRRAQGGATWLAGLPGNPVSSFMTFLLLVRPVLLQMQGASPLAPEAIMQRADFDWPRPDRRREFLRVRRNSHGGLDLFPNQSSGVLTSAVWADGVVDNPPDNAIRVGDNVRFMSWSAFLA